MNRHAYGVSFGLLLVLPVLISACATTQIYSAQSSSYLGTSPEEFWWSDKVQLRQLRKNGLALGSGRTVAVLDSGFTGGAPDLNPSRIDKRATETCSSTPTSVIDDINGHGTAMAVIALGELHDNTSKDLATGGMAAKANLLPIKVVCGVSTADRVARGVDIALAGSPKVDVILLALGGWPSDRTTDGRNETVHEKLLRVVQDNRDVLFVVASVWDGRTSKLPTWATEDNAIAVAATTLNLGNMPGIPVEDYYSDHRGEIGAPGRDIQTTFIEYGNPKISPKYGDYLMQGSSAAAALVAGCAAAVKIGTEKALTLKKRLLDKGAKTLPRGELRLDCFAALTPSQP